MEIFDLISKKNLKGIKKFAKSHDLNAVTNEITPLYFACQNKSFEVVKLLIELGVDVNAINSDGDSPIHIVAKFSQSEILNYLVEKGAKLNVLNQSFFSPLHFACAFSKDLVFIKLLISKGANLNFPPNGTTPLHFSCKSNANIDIVKLLLKEGANPNCQNDQLRTPLHFIAMNRLGPEFIELFIENGAFVNSRDKFENTPLAVFCRSKSTPRFDSIKTLIDYGGSIRSEDINKKTPLDALTDKEVMKEINEYYSIVGEFEDLLIRKELTDFVFECSDESIECHKDILRMRLGNEIFMNLNKDIFKNYTSNETQIFLRFVYCGVIQTFQDLDLLEKISKEIGLANFKEKIGKKSLLHDLNELYKDEKSKDFRIKCKNGQELKIHKIVLATRSNLFRSMFIMVKESSDSVSDYSERSIQSLNILFYWLYHDKFPDEIEVSEELYQEFLEFEDFYQLEKTSNFNSILESKKK